MYGTDSNESKRIWAATATYAVQKWLAAQTAVRSRKGMSHLGVQ